jgi:4-hydroxy-3-methylbut-2-enyl diphosphate reductase
MAGPHGQDICYATTNRQEAVKRFAPACDLVLVLGGAASSNSVRLVETARRAGARAAQLIEDADALDPSWLEGVKTLGLTAGASSPETLVKGVLERLASLFTLEVDEDERVHEPATFKLPRALAG